MAKVQFERTKPHVNAAIIGRLTQMGVSHPGAHQLLEGQPVTGLRDRQLIAELVAVVLDPNSGLLPAGHKFALSRHID
jgi:hypothetical protein